MELSLALAFGAGVLSFITPCVLALVPVYLAFLAEAAASTSGPTAQTPTAVTPVRSHPVFVQALLFIGGFGAVFVVLGIAAGVIGSALFREPLVRQLTGVVIIVLGVVMTGALGPVLDRLPTPAPAVSLPAGRISRAMALGALVALGWTPCIGPVLGAILAMGASSQDVARSASPRSGPRGPRRTRRPTPSATWTRRSSTG